MKEKRKKQQKNKDKKEQGGTEAVVKGWELNDFVVHLKQRELHESNDVAVECRCLKKWDLLFFLICFSILVLKWQQVSPISLELQLAQVNSYTRKDFKCF